MSKQANSELRGAVALRPLQLIRLFYCLVCARLHTSRWITKLLDDHSNKREIAKRSHPADAVLAVRADKWLRHFSQLLPGASTCLHRSIALVIFLTDQGLVAKLRIGVQHKDPVVGSSNSVTRSSRGFVAHAWVEVDGVEVGGALPRSATFSQARSIQQNDEQ